MNYFGSIMAVFEISRGKELLLPNIPLGIVKRGLDILRSQHNQIYYEIEIKK